MDGVNMKSYAIYDADLDRTSAVGYLFYYEKSKEYIIELQEDLDEWEAPLLFQKLVREKQYTVPRDISLMWIRERTIPSGRQNIGSILKNHNIKEYNEMALLEISKGKCSQDNCYIQKIKNNQIPGNIKIRSAKNIRDCFPTEDNQIICMYKDDTVQKVDLSLLLEKYNDLSYILTNKMLLESLKVGVGGYSIVFNESIEVPTFELRKIGIALPIISGDLLNFARRNLLGTTQICNKMECSRQKFDYLVKMNKIQPIITETKERLYLKGDIETIMSE